MRCAKIKLIHKKDGDKRTVPLSLTATVTVHDTYNFDTYREWNSFGNAMNNLAYSFHGWGGGNDFEWFATYTYSTKWTMDN